MKINQSLWISLGLSQLLSAALLPILLTLLAYLHPVVLAVVWLSLTLFVVFVVYLLRKETIRIYAVIIKIAMVIYSLGLLVLLFFRPANQEYNEINLVPFRTIANFLFGDGIFLIAFYNITANILLFVPYGAATLLLYRNPSRAHLVLGPAVAILLIEMGQYLTKRGSLDIDDFILNLLGVGLGYLLFPMIQKVVKVN